MCVLCLLELVETSRRPSLLFFSLSTKEDRFSVSIQPAVGELLMPSTMTEEDFSKEQGDVDLHQCL